MTDDRVTDKPRATLKIPDNSFWDFSLSVYGQEGVAPACLRLQERNAADVNILLFICWWCGMGRGRLEARAFATMADTVDDWHRTYVRSLRGLRSRLKEKIGESKSESVTLFAEALRQQIKTSELFAEQIEQLMLYELSETLPVGETLAPVDDARESAKNYIASLGKSWSTDDAEDFGYLQSAMGNANFGAVGKI